ncbi:MAG: aminoglycoside phosphotransferase family protein [Clostridia bacterium]
MEKLLQNVASNFNLGGEVIEGTPFGQGHVNTTYLVTVKAKNSNKQYILQEINTSIFTNPDALMDNIFAVTDFLKEKIIAHGGNINKETLNFLKTNEGKKYFTHTNGSCWRVYHFVGDTICLEKVESADDFYTVAETFGNFQNLLGDYPADTLHETIEKFHDTPNRFNNFKIALETDKMGRAKDVQKEIDFVLAHEKDCSVLKDLLDAGKLPLKVTHNDTKLNNVLIDKETGKGICVIDLDTVMPGLALHDYGDSIRFGANNCAEDEQDLTKVNFSLDLFEVFTKGFMSSAGKALTETEKAYLPWGAKLMTLECGMRFLTDHLDGDTYFKIHRENHNLDRCRTQFKLVSDMEEVWEQMENIVKKYC